MRPNVVVLSAAALTQKQFANRTPALSLHWSEGGIGRLASLASEVHVGSLTVRKQAAEDTRQTHFAHWRRDVPFVLFWLRLGYRSSTVKFYRVGCLLKSSFYIDLFSRSGFSTVPSSSRTLTEKGGWPKSTLNKEGKTRSLKSPGKNPNDMASKQKPLNKLHTSSCHQNI